MSQYSYSSDKYDEKTKAFNALRSQASALRRAKATTRKITSWDPATNAGTKDFREKTILLGRDIGGVVNYFDNKRSSALEAICEDEFTIHYQVYGDINREAVYGQNTLSIFLPIRWTQCEVAATLYPDNLDKTIPREKFTTAAREGIPNRDDIAKVTGWDRNAVRAIPDAQISTFKTLIDQVIVGQSKLTRLVKGFLLLLETMGRGNLDVVLDVQNTIMYGPADVINSYNNSGRAYVYNSRPSSAVHTAVLWRMCGAYPPPEIPDSHITIPSDGQNVFMVLEGQLPPNGRHVQLTPGLVYASLMAYAMDVSCTQHLQQALIIACSLQQNRYFSRVKLPMVASLMDLMIPAFMTTSSRLDKPIISLEMSRSIGRLHQMLMFMNVKDVLTAAELSSKRGFDPAASMRAYMGSQANLISRMGGEITGLSLVEATLKMKVHEVMDEDDFSDILELSALEGLWLCQEGTKCVKNGVIAALVNGVADLSGDVTSYDIVRREMDLGHIVYDRSAMPSGEFTVGWVCVAKDRAKRIAPQVKRITRSVTLVHPCNEQPGSKLRMTKKKRFFKETTMQTQSREPVSHQKPIDVSYLRKRAMSVRSTGHVQAGSVGDVSAAGSDPPDYEEVNSDPSTSVSGDSTKLLRTEIAEEAAAVVAGKASQSCTLPGQYEASKEIPSLKRSAPSPEVRAGLPTAVVASSGSDGEKVSTNFSDVNWAEVLVPKPAEKSILKVVGEPGVQLEPTEVVDLLLARSGPKLGRLSGKERASLVAILRKVAAIEVAAHSKDIESLVDHLTRTQAFVNYTGNAMSGNSNLAKQINRMIDLGAPAHTVGSQLRDMMNKKRAWTGDIINAPRDGLRHVVNSQPWLDFLEQEGIPADEVSGRSKGSNGTRMAFELGDLMTRLGSDFPLTDTIKVYNWITKTSQMMFPLNITPEQLTLIGPPATLEFRRPTSYGPRDEVEDDSKYLVLASRLNQISVDREYLIKLSSKFDLPRDMITHFRDVYDMFRGPKKM